MTLLDIISPIVSEPAAKSLFIAMTGVLFALTTTVFSRKLLNATVAHTETRVDDLIVEQMRGPISLSIAFGGFWLALDTVHLPDIAEFFNQGLWGSAVVVSWTLAGSRLSSKVLETLSRHQGTRTVIQARTLPIFELLSKVLIFGASVYFFFLAWQVDLTAWVASAGILGIAIGFGAQETLSDFFAGIAIMADGPFKLGDFLVIDGDERGHVTEIGLRTTRLSTPDGIELIIPNRVLATSKIVNESGGTERTVRIAVTVGVAYGTDIHRVKEILVAVATALDTVATMPPPVAQFIAFGDSSLDFRLLVWVVPGQHMVILDLLNTAIYNELNRAQIAIPFPQRDLHFITQATISQLKKEAPTQGIG